MIRSGIEIEGHIGTWYIVDESLYQGKKVLLLEHDEFGDEAACLIVDENMSIVLEDVWNGFDDLCHLN